MYFFKKTLFFMLFFLVNSTLIQAMDVVCETCFRVYKNGKVKKITARLQHDSTEESLFGKRRRGIFLIFNKGQSFIKQQSPGVRTLSSSARSGNSSPLNSSQKALPKLTKNSSPSSSSPKETRLNVNLIENKQERIFSHDFNSILYEYDFKFFCKKLQTIFKQNKSAKYVVIYPTQQELQEISLCLVAWLMYQRNESSSSDDDKNKLLSSSEKDIIKNSQFTDEEVEEALRALELEDQQKNNNSNSNSSNSNSSSVCAESPIDQDFITVKNVTGIDLSDAAILPIDSVTYKALQSFISNIKKHVNTPKCETYNELSVDQFPRDLTVRNSSNTCNVSTISNTDN